MVTLSLTDLLIHLTLRMHATHLFSLTKTIYMFYHVDRTIFLHFFCLRLNTSTPDPDSETRNRTSRRSQQLAAADVNRSSEEKSFAERQSKARTGETLDKLEKSSQGRNERRDSNQGAVNRSPSRRATASLSVSRMNRLVKISNHFLH